MSALPQPNFKEIDYSVSLENLPQTTSVENSLVTSSRLKTTKLPHKKRYSARLQLLKLLQRSSAYVAATVMLGSVGIYLSTVRIPQLWSQEYETLELLQRQERQLVAVDEALKYEVAQQATQPELEMSAISPENTKFLAQAAIEPKFKPKSEENQELWQTIPLGY